MSGNQPFAQYTFIIATPDNVSVHPGLRIRAVALLMRQHQQNNQTPTLYIKRDGSASLGKCYYQHKLAGIEDGRLFHEATFTEEAGLGARTTVHWQDPVEHRIIIRPSPKMDAHGLVYALCTAGDYSSAPSDAATARLAGNQHANTMTERERHAV